MNDTTKLMVRTAYDALDEKLGQDIEIIDIQNVFVPAALKETKIPHGY